MYPHSGFFGALVLVLCALVPFFVPSFRCLGSRNMHQNHPFGNRPLANPKTQKLNFANSGFWQHGFFTDLYFWAAGFFRGFSRRIFLLILVGKKCPKKILQENPRQNPPNFLQKSPTHFCRGAGPNFCKFGEGGGEGLNLVFLRIWSS